ncbi:polysaccharide biosynthesis protein [Candidatus Saccharibacteria bacterium]|nr:polysaccharide biosynthesis protein [Candidatus Saccharibacteria bacterium]
MDNSKRKVIIIGAGDAGQLLVENLTRTTAVKVVGYLDDASSLQDASIANLPVLGKLNKAKEVVEQHDVDELFFAIPSQRGQVVRNLVLATQGLGLEYKILPMQTEVLLEDFKGDFLQYIKKVGIEDLIGGEIHKSEQQQVSSSVEGKCIAVTGAAGSIGSELVRQLVAHGASKVVLFDWWENGMFDLLRQLQERGKLDKVYPVIGDVKNKKKLLEVFSKHKPDGVFHAAAYKHVPLMESNPTEAVLNNVLGTRNVAEAAIECGVKKFTLVSTDKAVNPTNVMGATKRLAEVIVNQLASQQDATKCTTVRFGNVMYSNGSVLPIFERQIMRGGPVTVTDERITRFFMTIPEAVHLILQSWVIGDNKDLFVLDMGEPVKIIDLARLAIILAGYSPEEDIEIEISGLRPGEKLYEEVLVKEEEAQATTIEKVFKTQIEASSDKDELAKQVAEMLDFCANQPTAEVEVRRLLRSSVHTYKPNEK